MCCIIQSDIQNVCYSPAQLFYIFDLTLSALHQGHGVSQLQLSPSPFQFPLPNVVILLWMLHPVIWQFIYRFFGYPYLLGEPCQVL